MIYILYKLGENVEVILHIFVDVIFFLLLYNHIDTEFEYHEMEISLSH